MFIYYFFASIAGIVAGIIVAARTKRQPGVVYGVLDKIGIATNILLIPAYVVVMTFCFFLVMLGYGIDNTGLLGVLSVIVAVIGASGPLFCGLGLGASVALRKKGKRIQSFLMQFAGVAGLAVTIIFYILFYGNLFATLN